MTTSAFTPALPLPARRGGARAACANTTSRKHRVRRSKQALRMEAREPTEEEIKARQEQDAEMSRMRSRLEGLFGVEEEETVIGEDDVFNGTALRNTILERWGVQYDVQPQKRHGRVYVQIMWRYFEQQSFYMDEEEFAGHCEAVAILLREWGAVDYFCDYIATIKKRPVVGITINIPIPGVTADSVKFE